MFKLRKHHKRLFMKIGIITWYIGYNLGAVLQAKALQYKINTLFPNCVCETIHYQTMEQNKSYNLLRQLYLSIKQILRGKKKSLYMMLIMQKRKRLNDTFIKKYIKESKNKYTEKTIIKSNEVYDLFICGSDQIWNPHWLDTVYLLDYVPVKRKIAYAASIGVEEIPNRFAKIYISNLKNYFSISTREKSGANALHKVDKESSLSNIEVVCDPTMLLNKKEWNTLLNIVPQKSNYAFIYLLDNNMYIKEKIFNYCKGKNIFVHFYRYGGGGYSEYDFCLNNDIKSIDFLSPKEFVKEIANAEIVFTDSFHGMCFSLIERTEFYVINRKLSEKGGDIYMNSRIDEVLEKLELYDRKIAIDTNIDSIRQKLNKDNFEKLDQYKNKSISWLRSTIEEYENSFNFNISIT